MYRAIILASTILLLCGAAAAGGFHDGRWRLDLSPQAAFNSEADAVLIGSLEYEFPAYPHGTLGLRLIPLFIGWDDNTIFGAGVGIATRVYANKEKLNGLYGELALSSILQSECFCNNDSRVNFISEAGVGYKFTNDWHAGLKIQHLSNAGLCDDNGGLNTFGISAGYTF
jgi:hypothetical protein